jgi:5'-deoxynucleotidase YfbR-like HD superfamily hydrolase
LPERLGGKYQLLFKEYLEQKTIESRFARAIDALEAEIHELDYKEDWKGWTLDFLKDKKSALFIEFPELNEAFNDILEYLVKGGYFDD